MVTPKFSGPIIRKPDHPNLEETKENYIKYTNL